MQFLSDTWAGTYSALLNEDPIVQKKLRKFSSCFKYEISDADDIETLIIEIIKGECTSYGPESAFRPKDIEFSMSANADTWQKIFDKKLGMKDALSKKLLHLDGPKIKALSNKSGLEQSARLMLGMEGITV